MENQNLFEIVKNYGFNNNYSIIQLLGLLQGVELTEIHSNPDMIDQSKLNENEKDIYQKLINKQEYESIVLQINSNFHNDIPGLKYKLIINLLLNTGDLDLDILEDMDIDDIVEYGFDRSEAQQIYYTIYIRKYYTI
jgi:hypothetical protein